MKVNIPNLIKISIKKNLSTNIILNDELLKALPLRSRMKQGFSLSPLLFNTSYKSSKREKKQMYKIKKRKKIHKNVRIGKKETVIFIDGKIMNMGSLKESTDNLLE